MTYYERIDELRTTTQLDADNMLTTHLEVEAALASLLTEQLMGAEITSPKYGTGKVTEVAGNNLENLIMVVAFADVDKRFAVLPVITGKVPLVKFADISEIGDAWDEAYNLHVDWSRQRLEFNRAAYRQNVEAKKQAEADKKAESNYNRTKDRMLKEFEKQTARTKEVAETDSFYYALGWLAKHMGSLTAILPDYLGAAFENHFGAETPKTLVDSRAKTSGGFAKQWSWEFKSTVKKLDETTVPECIQNVTTDFSKGIHNTAFLWDLVENYGFQFGKKQDVEKIRACVPSGYLASFEAGLA